MPVGIGLEAQKAGKMRLVGSMDWERGEAEMWTGRLEMEIAVVPADCLEG